MDIKEFDFPELSNIDLFFPANLRTIPELLQESKSRGFYNGNTDCNNIFSHLFFRGGELCYKKDLDENFKNRCSRYLKAFMSSFEPKHEEKEAICAMLLSELVNIKEQKKKLSIRK